jgi:hypothetical protein
MGRWVLHDRGPNGPIYRLLKIGGTESKFYKAPVLDALPCTLTGQSQKNPFICWLYSCLCNRNSHID